MNDTAENSSRLADQADRIAPVAMHAHVDTVDLRALFDAFGDRNALARCCGWRNLAKGRRRLQALAEGDLRLYSTIREALAHGLTMELSALDAVVAAMRERQAEQGAATFVPHVIWRTENSRPAGICLAAFTGMGARLRFQPGRHEPLAMLTEAVANCPDGIPLFGRVVGFVINYRPDLAICFDRHGRPEREHDAAIVAGMATGTAARLGNILMPN